MEGELQMVMQALEAYGIRPDSPVEALTGGTANRNYAIREGGRTFIMRIRSAKYSDEAWIDFEEQYLLHMEAKGIPVPVPLEHAHGSRRCTIGSDTLQLFPYLGGQPFQPNSAEELAEAGALLGRLHLAAAEFRTDVDKTLPRYDDPAVIVRSLKRVLADHRELTPWQHRIVDGMLACAARVQDRIPDAVYRALPHTVVHGDYHPANVAFRDGRASALYDFDWISPQPRLRDIADLIVYFAAVRDEPFDGGSIYSLNQGCTFDSERSAVALQAYVRHAGAPLTAEELAALPEFMAARLLHSRVQALAKVPPERSVDVLTKAIEPSLAWLTANRTAFLDRISNLN